MTKGFRLDVRNPEIRSQKLTQFSMGRRSRAWLSVPILIENTERRKIESWGRYRDRMYFFAQTEGAYSLMTVNYYRTGFGREYEMGVRDFFDVGRAQPLWDCSGLERSCEMIFLFFVGG